MWTIGYGWSLTLAGAGFFETLGVPPRLGRTLTHSPPTKDSAILLTLEHPAQLGLRKEGLMRSSRLTALAAVVALFVFALPIAGLARRGSEDPRGYPSINEHGRGRFTAIRHRTLNKIDCRFTCRDGSSYRTPVDTVDDCFWFCQYACGNPCDWAS
jgi:hypothetical protein